MNRILSLVAALLLLASPVAAQKGHHRSHASSGPRYSGSHHSASHGGYYSGGHGSSHKGGHYVNPRTGNHYGHHKR